MKRVYYKKGYLIDFNDGGKKLVIKATRVSYEMIKVENQTIPLQFNTDYIIYSSLMVKYGVIPINSIISPAKNLGRR